MTKVNTIDKILEIFKKSYNIIQVFLFLIQKISNEESNRLFKMLYQYMHPMLTIIKILFLKIL